MLGILALFGWGAAGSFIYAANALILGLWNDASTKPQRIRAVVEFIVALTTGGIAAAGITRPLVGVLDAGVNVNGVNFRLEPDQIAVALTVGWVSNYLLPRLLKKIGDRVDTLGNEKSA